MITMNDAREFIRSTSPWVAMGLLVAILVIRGAASTKNAKNETAENYGMGRMSLGMCFGLLISVMFGRRHLRWAFHWNAGGNGGRSECP